MSCPIYKFRPNIQQWQQLDRSRNVLRGYYQFETAVDFLFKETKTATEWWKLEFAFISIQYDIGIGWRLWGCK